MYPVALGLHCVHLLLGGPWGASGSMPSNDIDGSLAKKPSASFM